MPALTSVAGLRLAFSWLTVLPVPAPGTVDRRVARTAITLAPIVGAVLGLVGTGTLIGLAALHAPPLLAGLLVVGLLAALTRGMHLDGLADTADGLGCYGPPERALAVMKDGGAGPFAVVTLIIALGAQTAALAAITTEHRWWLAVLAVVAGRAAFAICCRSGVPAARSTGLGALVADSQPIAVPMAWWAVLAGLGTLVVPGRWWQGPIAVAVAGGAVLALSKHTRRRFGGVTGDVLGAASELAVTAVLTMGVFG